VDFPVFDCDGAGGDIWIRVLYGPNAQLQGTSVTINVYRPNWVIGNIRVIIGNTVAPQLNNNVTLSVRGINGGSISSIGSIERSGTNGELWIGEVLANNIGSITGARVTTIRSLAGNITGPILATGGQNQPGNIDVIEAVGGGGLGKILGNISAAGSITNGIFASSDIGTPTTPVNITWGTNTALSDTRLGTVQAANIHANITATSRNAATNRGNVSKIRATSGTFTGSLSALGFTGGTAGDPPGIITVGSLAASVDMLAPLSSSSFIKAGTTLTGAITLPANGLAGQIIPNAFNATSSAWTGSVTVGTTVLNPASFANGAYSTLSSTLGGGAVGLVPYRLYASDCAPPHHDDWIVPSGEPKVLNSRFNGTAVVGGVLQPKVPVRMRFYGPVKTDAPAGTSPVAVWLWLDDSSGVYQQWHNVTSLLNVTVTRTGNPMSREVVITPIATQGSLPPGYYAVTAIREGANRLYCDGTLATVPPSVATNMPGNYAQYNFQLFSDCGDAQNPPNGVWDADEIAAIPSLDTNNDGYLDSCVSPQWICPADLDNGSMSGIRNGGVGIEDLVFFLHGFEVGLDVVDLDNDGDPAVGTPDAAVTIEDLLYFLNHFEGGC
jgi:hypothetical protein